MYFTYRTHLQHVLFVKIKTHCVTFGPAKENALKIRVIAILLVQNGNFCTNFVKKRENWKYPFSYPQIYTQVLSFPNFV